MEEKDGGEGSAASSSFKQLDGDSQKDSTSQQAPQQQPLQTPTAAMVDTPKRKATNRDVFYALVIYLVLPYLLLNLASIWYDHLTIYEQQCNKNHECPAAAYSSFYQSILPYKNLLVLGFSSPTKMWKSLEDRFISISCWGWTFFWVRKGWNPESRSHLFRFWRGAVLSTLAVYYSSVGRQLFKHTPIYQHYFHGMWQWDAAFVGIFWGLSSIVIRRRLDPALCNKLVTPDLFFGSCSLSVTAYINTHYKHAMLVYMVDQLSSSTWVSWALEQQDNRIVTSLCSWLALSSSHDLLRMTVDALLVGLWWGVPYLWIRRGCNPQSSAVFVSKFGNDAYYGSWALVVYVFMKRLVQVWWFEIVVPEPEETSQKWWQILASNISENQDWLLL